MNLIREIFATAIDTWTGFAQPQFGTAGRGSMLGEFQDNLRTAGFQMTTDYGVAVEDAREASKLFSPDSIRVLFIDDDHGWHQVKVNFDVWLPKMKKDWCIIAGHDYPTKGIKKFIDETYPERKLYRSINCTTPKTPVHSTFAIRFENYNAVPM